MFLPRARADGKEEIDCEKVYGPLGSIKLPYDPPRSIMPGAESRECGKNCTKFFRQSSFSETCDIGNERRKFKVDGELGLSFLLI